MNVAAPDEDDLRVRLLRFELRRAESDLDDIKTYTHRLEEVIHTMAKALVTGSTRHR